MVKVFIVECNLSVELKNRTFAWAFIFALM